MAAPIIRVLAFSAIFMPVICYREFSSKEIDKYRQRVTEMFHHAYDGYIQYAYPLDELRPLTCDGHDTWGSYSLTLIDALDMLVIMGNNTEFQRVAQLVIDKMDFDNDINVSVFETNIRVVGGLLSAHLMSKRGGLDLEPGWPCSGPLLRMAENVARRLLPAFDTPTGMPYGTVNLKYGVPKGETTVTCTAGIGTFIVEFGALSKLTGDPIFEKVAMRAMRGLWKARSSIDLVGNHVDVATGKWTALDAGVGGGVDSYFEYLVKGSVMFSNTELLDMFYDYLKSVEKYLKKDDWYMWAHMTKGTISLPIFTSLDCYWPGIQAMLGDVDKAMKTLHNFHQVWKQFGFLPEFYNIVKNEAHVGREGYPLRPELIEAAMYLYQATGDQYLLQIGVDMLESIEDNTRTQCGYATVKDVTTHTLENRMESFFLAETTKYLYLLFDPDNFIHNTGDHGTVVDTPSGQCVIDTGSYIFNTEAHPIDTAALYCCSAEKKEHDLELQDFYNNLDLLTLFDLHDSPVKVEGVKLNSYKRKNITEPILTDFSETIQKYQESLESGEHQRILSTKGEKFTLKGPESKTKVVTIDGKNIKKTATYNLADGQNTDKIDIEQGQGQTAAQGQSIHRGQSQTSGQAAVEGKSEPIESQATSQGEGVGQGQQKLGQGQTPQGQENLESGMKQCEKDGDCENDVKSDKYAEIGDTVKSDKSPDRITISVNTKQAAENEKEAVKIDIAAPEKPSPQSSFLGGKEKITDVLNLIKSFTEDYLENQGVKSIKTLHEKLKYYSLFHYERPDMLTCKAQPFYMRFSIMGEMFLNDFL